MTNDLYVWKAPRELDASEASALIDAWQDEGGDPAASPFEPSTDVGWFYRELLQDVPDLVASTDALPTRTRTPIWLSSEQEPPARVVGMRLGPPLTPDAIESIVGLAAKYDLVVWDARGRTLHRPLDDFAAVASATFWPGGAIQAAVAGLIGLGLAVAAWVLGIPVLSGLAIVIGGFMAVMSLYTFVHEGRRRIPGRTRSEDDGTKG